MNYQPNLNDPRVLNRIRHAIGFCLGVMSTTQPRQWSTRHIDKYLGQSQRPLGKYLRSHLLICVNNKWNKETGECKSYILNQLGLNLIKEQIQKKEQHSFEELPNGSKMDNNNISPITYPIVSEVGYDQYVVKKFVEKEYQNELKSGDFDYDFKSNRYWHGLQSIKTQYRTSILSDYGYQYNYDIEACAPTLLLQHSRKLGNDLWLPNLDNYLNNKRKIRHELAVEADLTLKQVKILINALFCGARLGNNKQFAISQLLKHDKAKIEYLKQHPFISELRNEIKTVWEYITPHLTRKSVNGRLKPISSRQKWGVYFQLECDVITSIKKYIKEKQLKCFLEHDGWVCEQELDQQELLEWVRQQTGYEIRLKLERTNET